MFKHAQLGLIFLFLVSIGLSNAIECIICDSLSNNDCVDLKEIEKEECGVKSVERIETQWLRDLLKFNVFQTHPDVKTPMQCVTVTIKKDDEEVVYRGCQSKNLEMCEIYTQKAQDMKNLEILNCQPCDEDGCNKSSLLVYSSFVYSVMFLIVLKVFH